MTVDRAQKFPVCECALRGDCSGVRGNDPPALFAASGESMIQSRLIMSRLCSMTRSDARVDQLAERGEELLYVVEVEALVGSSKIYKIPSFACVVRCAASSGVAPRRRKVSLRTAQAQVAKPPLREFSVRCDFGTPAKMPEPREP